MRQAEQVTQSALLPIIAATSITQTMDSVGTKSTKSLIILHQSQPLEVLQQVGTLTSQQVERQAVVLAAVLPPVTLLATTLAVVLQRVRLRVTLLATTLAVEQVNRRLLVGLRLSALATERRNPQALDGQQHGQLDTAHRSPQRLATLLVTPQVEVLQKQRLPVGLRLSVQDTVHRKPQRLVTPRLMAHPTVRRKQLRRVGRRLSQLERATTLQLVGLRTSIRVTERTRVQLLVGTLPLVMERATRQAQRSILRLIVEHQSQRLPSLVRST